MAAKRAARPEFDQSARRADRRTLRNTKSAIVPEPSRITSRRSSDAGAQAAGIRARRNVASDGDAAARIGLPDLHGHTRGAPAGATIPKPEIKQDRAPSDAAQRQATPVSMPASITLRSDPWPDQPHQNLDRVSRAMATG